jgi:DNA polymerase-3 subunit alpha
MYLIFDTETTGLPLNYNAPVTDSANWPRMVQLAWEVHDKNGLLVFNKCFIIKPENYIIPQAAEKVHGISTEKALAEGIELNGVLQEFEEDLRATSVIIGHNVSFDISIIGAEFARKAINTCLFGINWVCTKEESTNFCALPGGKGGKFKWPTLAELYDKLFDEGFSEAHHAAADVAATARAFFELLRKGVIKPDRLKIDKTLLEDFRTSNPGVIMPFNITLKSNFEPATVIPVETDVKPMEEDEKFKTVFTHLHVLLY